MAKANRITLLAIALLIAAFLPCLASAEMFVQNITLSKGWNEVIFNILPEDPYVWDVLASIRGNIIEISTVGSNSVNEWAEDNPEFGNDLDTLMYDMKYYIKVDSLVSFAISGKPNPEVPYLINTTPCSWYNVSECIDGKQTQAKNWTQYDYNQLVPNITFFEYASVECTASLPANEIEESFELKPGWNQVIFNVLPDDASLLNVLSQIKGKLKKATTIESGQAQEWAEDNPDFGNDLVSLSYEQAYFLDLKDYATLKVKGHPKHGKPYLINTSWSDWYNLSGCHPNDTMDIARNLTQYDYNSILPNVTFYQYNTTSCTYCTPIYVNTTWTEWANEGCLLGDVRNQSRSLIQYDANSCGKTPNITFYEYRYSESCDYCTPNLQNTSWSEWSNITCALGDLMNQSRHLVQSDSNYCNETPDTAFYEYQLAGACDFCTPAPVNTTISDSAWINISCLSSNLMYQEQNITQYDSNFCGEAGNQTYIYRRQSEYCNYQEGFSIDLISITPDDLNLSYEVEVSPEPDSEKRITVSAIITDTLGIDSVNSVILETAKGPIIMERVGTLDSDTANYSAGFNMDYSDIPALYQVNVIASDTLGRLSNSSAYYRYLALSSATFDSPTILFPQVSPGEHASLDGDLDMATTNKPTIKNTGNVPINISIYGSDLSGAVTIPVSSLGFRLNFSQYYNLTKTSVIYAVGEGGTGLAVMSTLEMDFSLLVPAGTPSGDYQGNVSITAVGNS